MPQTIDLRKKQAEAKKPSAPSSRFIIKQPSETKSKSQPAQVQNIQPPTPLDQKIAWETLSFDSNPDKKYINIAIILLAIGGGALIFSSKDILTAIFLFLASFVLFLYSGQKPELIKIGVNHQGVAISDTMYYYKDLSSFWIHYNPGEPKELSLEIKRWYIPYIVISIEDKNPLLIRDLMIKYLPEKEHQRSLVDMIARRMGL